MPKDPLDNARDHSHATENENLQPNAPPRPATEPQGSQGSSQGSKTLTDPATGQPNTEKSK